ncbi:MAG: ComEA family DNA-binding protein [Chitinispirillaceae bacterium]
MKLRNGIAVFIWILNAGLIVYAGLRGSDSAPVTVVDSGGGTCSLDSLVAQGEIEVVSEGKRDDSMQSSLEENENEEKVESDTSCININCADAQKLKKIKGVGPVLVEKIMQYRLKQGEFRTKHDLQKVKGIGPVKMEKISQQICF